MKRSAKQQARINCTLRLLEVHTRHVNCIRLHKSTTRQHRDKMYEICTWLLENDMDFVTEAKFNGGGRADIVVLEEGVAIEILHTEDITKFNKKEYPILAIAHRTDQEWKGL